MFTDTIIFVKNKFLYYALASILGLSGCIGIESQTPEIILPEFVTATLPTTSIPQPTITPFPPTPAPTIAPVNGTTTTKVNVRAETSSASDNLGTIDQFSTVQVIGKDATGSWYKIIFSGSPNGAGWVRTDYIQLDAQAEIPFVDSGTGRSGLVTQGINVRSGPGTTYNSVGILNQKDVVTMTGRNSDASWIQIAFAGGSGWLSAQYLEGADFESLPVVDDVKEESLAETSNEPGVIQVSASLNDFDSRDAPLADITLGNIGARMVIIKGTLSHSTGDIDDWIKFNSSVEYISINLDCNSPSLRIEVWDNNGLVETPQVKCGETLPVQVKPSLDYILRLTNTPGDTNLAGYTLSLGVGD